MSLINTDKAKARLNEIHHATHSLQISREYAIHNRFLWVSLATEENVIHKFH